MTSRPEHFPGLKSYVATCALTALLLSPTLADAESVATSEWNISADKITRYEDPQSIVAEGNIILEKREQVPPKKPKVDESVTSWSELLGEKPVVQEETVEEVVELIEQEPTYKTTFHIEADWLAYDEQEQTIKARGNVKIITGGDTVMADKGQVDLETQTGSFTDAIILRKKDDVHLEGELIEKTGVDTYHISKGWVITCKIESGETPPWSFASSDTTVKEDGYAVLKHATFNIKGVPIFYTPYMVLPVKNTRQTGFTFPEVSYSDNNGVGFNAPFFWNISDSVDMTLFPEYYYERGFMPGAEFRYVQNASNKGTIIGSYIDDKLTDPDETEYYQDTGYTHTDSNRYWVRGKADHTFTNDWVTRLDLDIVSDRAYLTEFNSGYTGYSATDDRFQDMYGRGFENRTDYARQNTLKFLKSWSGQSLELNLLGINDVEEEDADSDELWKLPNLVYSGVTPIGKTALSFEWNADYVNYWREEGVGGHRIDVRPAVSGSVPLSPYLESRAELGVRDTFYSIDTNGDAVWEEDDTQNRLIADFEFEVASTLLKNFDTNNDLTDDFDHQFRPFVKYQYIPDVDQDDLPQFDSVDTISERNQIEYGIDNFFNTFAGDSTREYGYAKIFQSYDLRSSASDEPFSDVTVRLGLKPSRKLRLEYDTDIDVYGDGFVSHSFEGSYTNTRGDFFSVDYSFNDSSDIEQINAEIKAKLFANWSAGLEVEHSIASDETNEANFSLMYQALCWSVEFESNYTPEDTRFLLVFNLANIGTPLGISL